MDAVFPIKNINIEYSDGTIEKFTQIKHLNLRKEFTPVKLSGVTLEPMFSGEYCIDFVSTKREVVNGKSKD